jgi:hypothetical protein
MDHSKKVVYLFGQPVEEKNSLEMQQILQQMQYLQHRATCVQKKLERCVELVKEENHKQGFQVQDVTAPLEQQNREEIRRYVEEGKGSRWTELVKELLTIVKDLEGLQSEYAKLVADIGFVFKKSMTWWQTIAGFFHTVKILLRGQTSSNSFKYNLTVMSLENMQKHA